MSDLIQVQTTNLQPAVVEFNYDAIAQHLDGVLQRYKGLVFTEKEVGECKKTIAELRKGQKALDEFRKNTKRELTESITAFENQCKELYKKFDEVIDPLTEQHDQFEHNRRQRKLIDIEKIALQLVEEQGLRDNFANELMAFPEEYFNKGKDLKDIRKELTTRAESLGIAQDKEDADREIIKTKVELANAKHGVQLLETPYVNLLEHKVSIDAIVAKINADAETLKQRVVPSAVPAPKTVAAVIADDSDTIYVDRYEISGTEAQFEALDNFLRANGYEWKILD